MNPLTLFTHFCDYRRAHPDAVLVFIMGEDSFGDIPKWYKWEKYSKWLIL